jgi:hypothetical protein
MFHHLRYRLLTKTIAINCTLIFENKFKSHPVFWIAVGAEYL